MPPSDRYQLPLRLPRDLSEWVQTQARRRSTSQNGYILGVLRDKYEADGAQRKAEGERRQRRDPDAPRGLGLARDPRSGPEAEPLPALEPAAPVVVNVGPAAGSGAAAPGDLVAGLAAHIAAGRPWERERRRRAALEVLRDACPAPGARKEAEERLDQAVREQERAGRRQEPSIGSIGSLFRP